VDRDLSKESLSRRPLGGWEPARSARSEAGCRKTGVSADQHGLRPTAGRQQDLRAAAQAYKVDTDAIALKVKHEFAAKEKARSAAKIEPKPVSKVLKKSA
jgi:hypothetical protein